MSSFAQTIGGSQSGTPLDLSEFPSLSSSQPQHQNSSQAAWASAPQRGTPVQRPQPNSNNNQATTAQQQQQDDLFPSASQFASGLDDFRSSAFGGQARQMAGSGQPQTGNIDEFPPLGRAGNGEIGQDRRGSLMQSVGFGGHANGAGFGPGLLQPQSLQTRSGLLSTISGHQEQTRQAGLPSAGLGSSVLSSSRSPIESMQQGQGGLLDQEKNNIMRSAQNGLSNPSLFTNPQNSQQAGTIAQAPSKQNPFPSQQRQPQQQPSYGGDFVDSPQAAQISENVGLSLSGMSDMERFGLTGLLGMIRNESQDLGMLAVGQDLTQLGLNLNQPDNSPLYQTFGSPWEETSSKPVEPDFSLPSCYAVHNIHPLQQKVGSFSDETLFYIFYTMPRDIMQEVVASELTNRNWRYHKLQKQWLTKDDDSQPVRISQTEERGFYIFFDPETWRRERREFLLDYNSLDGRGIQSPAVA
ncbi:hypothetical protein FGG08_002204 [Glutinoglossum americanum]|uniref:NOT2/NOT3/NOT5 C-terminal domain-containing protein n=1 Tax=Glutinoglossum americanum TaxID=1670608 RepID=A0A9P8IFI5_9PEZI|nr:hypothetical protein FGG08_002204 [Glutinoglossum americanum]